MGKTSSGHIPLSSRITTTGIFLPSSKVRDFRQEEGLIYTVAKHCSRSNSITISRLVIANAPSMSALAIYHQLSWRLDYFRIADKQGIK